MEATKQKHIFQLLQVNPCQKLSFLNHLTHNMTRDCSLNYKKNTSSEHVLTFKTIFVRNMFSGNSMNNHSSYCGLSDSRMRASDTDLTVKVFTTSNLTISSNIFFLFIRREHHS